MARTFSSLRWKRAAILDAHRVSVKTVSRWGSGIRYLDVVVLSVCVECKLHDDERSELSRRRTRLVRLEASHVMWSSAYTPLRFERSLKLKVEANLGDRRLSSACLAELHVV